MRISLFILCILFLIPSLRSEAQDYDSLVLKQDSTPLLTDKKQKIKITHFIVPAALITYGLIGLESDGLKYLDTSTKDEIREDNPLFNSKIDNYMQFVPGAMVFALNGLGIQGKHNWKDAALIYGGSIVITSAFVFPLKYITQVERPDGSSKNSFPSGHTAIAFASAEFLRREYWDTSPWIGVAGYAMATSTGVLRMYNNRHWVTDVVAGAGFGIASTTLSYIIYDNFLKRNHLTFNLAPTYYDGNVGLSFMQVF